MALKRRKRVTKLSQSVKEYPKLTGSQALDIVLAGKRAEGIRERTLKDYVKMYGYFEEWLNENYEFQYVNELSPEVFRNYINYLQYDKQKYSGHKLIDYEKQPIGLAKTTININLRALKALFNFLYREGMIEVNPVENVKLLRVENESDLKTALTDEEVKGILAQPNLREFVGFRDFVAINTLLDTGLRIQELLSLRAGDVDIASRFITIQAGRSKNLKARLVPMSTHVSKLLLQLITENREHFKTDRIFLSSYGEPIQANHFNKRLKYHAEKAGVEGKKVTAHIYRHTWAKNMILNGCDPFTLQKIGGWADIRTMRRYIQMDVTEMRSSHDQYSPVMKLNKRG
ncbi:tyrosine-type recombinase/integrase [Gracilibacillus caseinilyticus]|uniref:Tyrosine-type recombinase/integrase n=1 Tax=Gracilibacillus caseinilyticus TaxID=2932256 RepID=A0ABY4EUQ5_9BACI|nr:tyrosine-type recombinase/integrase [Gracilibacillus caseinilyticus]UOQ48142.1 tyrosine-type recombinase/integrase [Gracilibacillus caseinilyticus]